MATPFERNPIILNILDTKTHEKISNFLHTAIGYRRIFLFKKTYEIFNLLPTKIFTFIAATAHSHLLTPGSTAALFPASTARRLAPISLQD